MALSVTTSAVPDTDAHSPEALMKEMLTCWSEASSSVFCDCVLVKKRRSMPFVSYCMLDAAVIEGEAVDQWWTSG
jgi:hypothetical protein